MPAAMPSFAIPCVSVENFDDLAEALADTPSAASRGATTR
jgi:hypothetical protein